MVTDVLVAGSGTIPYIAVRVKRLGFCGILWFGNALRSQDFLNYSFEMNSFAILSRAQQLFAISSGGRSIGGKVVYDPTSNPIEHFPSNCNN